jgi:hypothetical protein
MDWKYFGPIEKGEVLKKQTFVETDNLQTLNSIPRPNIQILDGCCFL